jgi:carbonic anhydrase
MTKRLFAVALAIVLAVPALSFAAVDPQAPAVAYSSLKSGNAAFVADPGFAALRTTLVAGQRPKAIVLGCADSRVSPELVFKQTLGDVFVTRIAGNYPAPGLIGSMEYAVEHLGAKLLVVLGHSSCGAVKTAVSHAELPVGSDLAWLIEQIQPTIDAAVAANQANPKSTKTDLDAAIEANADAAAARILANSVILNEAYEREELKVVVGIYDLATGKVAFHSFLRD